MKRLSELDHSCYLAQKESFAWSVFFLVSYIFLYSLVDQVVLALFILRFVELFYFI